MGSSRWLLKVRLHLSISISTALMRPRRPKQYCLQLDIALWCKNQIEHSIWDESLLLSNCARSLEYSSSSTLAGLSYHICGKLEVAFKGSPSSQHQHCTDEAQRRPYFWGSFLEWTIFWIIFGVDNLLDHFGNVSIVHPFPSTFLGFCPQHGSPL